MPSTVHTAPLGVRTERHRTVPVAPPATDRRSPPQRPGPQRPPPPPNGLRCRRPRRRHRLGRWRPPPPALLAVSFYTMGGGGPGPFGRGEGVKSAGSLSQNRQHSCWVGILFPFFALAPRRRPHRPPRGPRTVPPMIPDGRPVRRRPVEALAPHRPPPEAEGAAPRPPGHTATGPGATPKTGDSTRGG